MNLPSTTPPPASIRLVDLDQWAQEDAHNANAKGYPPDFQSYSMRIKLIVQTYTTTITRDFHDQFNERTVRLRDNFVSISKSIPTGAKTLISEIEANINAAIATSEKRYAPKISALQRELSEWESVFKYGFFDGIANPKKRNIVLHAGVILFLLAVEVILNSRFFAETSEYGLLGGTMAAVTVSTVNVGIPILIAFFSHKLIFSKTRNLRIVGIAMSAILMMLVAILFNYEVAEYRERLLLLAEKPPSSLPEYIALLAIGGGVAIISFWKTFSFMDPYFKPRRCHKDLEGTIASYKTIGLTPVSDKQREVAETIEQLTLLVEKSHDVIQHEQSDFQAKCSLAMSESSKMIDYYHLKYCPHRADPDPDKPIHNSEDYDFAATSKAVFDTLSYLNENCAKAKAEWLPLLDEAKRRLIETNQRYQAVIVANIGTAVQRGSD